MYHQFVNGEKMNIAFCVNDKYIEQLLVVLTSLALNNKKHELNVYIFSSDITDESKVRVNKLFSYFRNASVKFIKVDTNKTAHLNSTIKYISNETYYRYLIADLLPDVDKILYMDADIIVNGNISKLYDTDMKNCIIAGVRDLYIRDINYLPEIGFADDDLYVNAGILLMNLNIMRKEKMGAKLIKETEKLSGKIKFNDQDVMNIVCKNKVLEIDSIYNFTSANMHNEPRKTKKARIIHYNGANKPWLVDSKHELKKIWKKYYEKTEKIMTKRKIRVGLLIDKFFGGAGTAFGGYGFLARKFIAKYIPNEDIRVDVLLGSGGHRFTERVYREDGVKLYRLPRRHWASKWFLKRKNYDVYLSIELTDDFVLKHETNKNKKLILWVQDPRPKSAWDNVIDTMKSIKDPCFYHQNIYDTVHELNDEKRVKFISQGYSLNPLAKELYYLPENTSIQYLPNPIELDMDFKFDIKKKEKSVIFLGRLEAQKRAWVFCEIAKRMPEYDFYVLGQFFRHRKDNERMLAPYMKNDIPNLHFVGHVDGKEKAELIKSARILCSTAIWEGIPISWLECLSYGTVLVSDLEREGLVEKFGLFTGDNPGDGFDGVDNFIPAIRELMENDKLYKQKAESAIKYIRETHNIPRFVNDLRNVIWQETKK